MNDPAATHMQIVGVEPHADRRRQTTFVAAHTLMACHKRAVLASMPTAWHEHTAAHSMISAAVTAQSVTGWMDKTTSCEMLLPKACRSTICHRRGHQKLESAPLHVMPSLLLRGGDTYPVRRGRQCNIRHQHKGKRCRNSLVPIFPCRRLGNRLYFCSSGNDTVCSAACSCVHDPSAPNRASPCGSPGMMGLLKAYMNTPSDSNACVMSESCACCTMTLLPARWALTHAQEV